MQQVHPSDKGASSRDTDPTRQRGPGAASALASPSLARRAGVASALARRGLLLLTGLVLLAVGASPSVSQNPQSPWAQKIFLGVSSHDFGTCPAGAQLKYRLTMKNIYAVPLEITEMRTSCGCLTPVASTKHLKPKEEAYIDVNMDATKFSGHKVVTLYVTVGPQYISQAAIQFTANARADVVFNPGQVNFGIVATGTTPTQLIDVEYAGALDWQIVEVVKNKSAPFTVSAQEMFRQPKGLIKNGKVGYRLQVTVNGDAPAGPFHQDLLLKTNDPASPVLTVHVEGSVQAALSVTPDQVKFDAVKPGEKASRKVVVRGKLPFRILSVEGLGNGIQAEWPDSAAALHVVNVHCQISQPGTINRKLTLHTDKGETLTITVSASVQ